MLQSVGKSLITWFGTGLLARPKIGSSGETCAIFLPEKLRLKKTDFREMLGTNCTSLVVQPDFPSCRV
jgi:hypothetical protein